MEKTLVIARSPEEFFSTRPSFGFRLLNRKDEIVGYRQSFETSRTRFGAQVLHAACNIEAAIEPDWVYFTIRQSLSSSVIFNSYGINRGIYAATILSSEFYSAMDAGYSSLVAAIRKDFLGAQDEFRDDNSWLLDKTRSFEIDKELYDNLVREMRYLCLYNYTSEEVDARIAGIFISLLYFLEGAEEVSTNNRHRIVSKSIRYIRNSDITKISPTELAAASHCSIRTLQYAFFRTLGISPKKYINRYRLAEFRKELLEARKIGRHQITSLARKYGFAHGGNLSSQYKEVYGRLPSKDSDEPNSQG